VTGAFSHTAACAGLIQHLAAIYWGQSDACYARAVLAICVGKAQVACSGYHQSP